MRYAIAVELHGGAYSEVRIVEAPNPETAIIMSSDVGHVLTHPTEIDPREDAQVKPTLSENLREAVTELQKEILSPQDDLRLGIMIKASAVVDLLKGML